MARTERNIHLAFGLFREAIAHPDRYGDDLLVIPFENLVGKASPFSKERLRILAALRGSGAESLDDLARSLKREKTRVSKDVTYLEGLGLVVCERVGRMKRIKATKRQILLG
ncbi:MAG: HVO_A0114 family putative DNA-binding protein [Thermoplasmatota archaeon]